MDATDDPLHGHQEGRFFHGYYRHYCYLPLYIFDGHWPVLAQLRTSDKEAAKGVTQVVAKIIKAIRKKLPRVKIILRADSGFCREELMSWSEANAVYYLLGIVRNAVLERELASTMHKAKELAQQSENSGARLFHEFAYKAKKWPGDKRRVTGKAEWTALELYEKDYCARGEMENRIKEQQLDLFADRTSTGTIRANQLRLWLSTLAYLLIHRVRQIGLKGTHQARASCGSLRLRLFKIGSLVKVSVRRVVVSLSSAYPWRELFEQTAHRLAVGPAG